MIVLCIVVIALCLCISALCSSADISFSCVNKLQLDKEKKKGIKIAKKISSLVDNYSNTISSILFLNNFVNIVASSFGVVLSKYLFKENPSGPVIIEIIMLFIIIIFGEILPKSLSKPFAYKLCKFYAYPVSVIGVIFKPIIFVSSSITNFISKPFTRKKNTDIPSDDELDSMIEQIEEEGIIDENQSKLLHRTIDFKETSANEIMTPRVSIMGLDYKEDLRKWVTSHMPITKSRLIVYKGNADKIVGYIPTKSLLKKCLKSADFEIEDLILPVLSVPSTMQISSVLKLMKKSHHHIAVVKDEYGGTDGILTLEDILEELVGEMYDESDKVQPFIRETNTKNRYVVSGRLDVDNLFERFKLDDDFIEEDYSTVSGWIIDKLGRFAVEGDKFSYGKIDIKVLKVTQYTVDEIQVDYHPRRGKSHD